MYKSISIHHIIFSIFLTIFQYSLISRARGRADAVLGSTRLLVYGLPSYSIAVSFSILYGVAYG